MKVDWLRRMGGSGNWIVVKKDSRASLSMLLFLQEICGKRDLKMLEF